MALPTNTWQAPLAGGLTTRLPQSPSTAGRAQNLTIDKSTGGWSTRIGYEPWEVAATSWSPFPTCAPVTSLHVAQEASGGARQHLLFEEGGRLNLLYEAAGSDVVRTLASGRSVPSTTEAGSWYTSTAYGTIVTNGVDRPILVRPWPLGNAVESAAAIASCVRPFGFTGLPTPAEPYGVKPYPKPPFPNPPKASGNGAVTLWTPYQGNAIPDGGRWGLGFANNVGGANGDKEVVFGYAVSFISDTGSEGPTSVLTSVKWALPADAQGLRHCTAVGIPVGPPGTVARKIYRTVNYSADGPAQGDTTLYFIELIRNNTDTVYFDAIASANLGQPAPAIATGPLPAPTARFSALFGGCLWLDGGLLDGRTLYYSAPGLIEQFDAASSIELSSEGGSITAIYSHYTSLLVFREYGIDVVQGDFANGFTVSTLIAGVTCRSPHSVAAVPGLGVVFLAVDGVYAMVGGLQGGSISEVLNLTDRIDGVMARLTPDCLAKAVGCYSALSREYHLYVPVDGSDRPNLGLVLHLEKLGDISADGSAWTTREGFPVGAISTLFDGTIVFGHHTGVESADQNAQRGLFLITGKRALGRIVDNDVWKWASPPVSAYRSAWYDFGDPQTQKQVTYVTLWVLTTGNPEVKMRHYKDFSLEPVTERTYLAQPPDASLLPVLGTATLGAKGLTYREPKLVPLRFSVAHQSAAWFCFEVETNEDLVIVGFEYEYSDKGNRVVAGVQK
jgi:hypothetical protein